MGRLRGNPEKKGSLQVNMCYQDTNFKRPQMKCIQMMRI